VRGAYRSVVQCARGEEMKRVVAEGVTARRLAMSPRQRLCNR
jgi:hypothetical protein